MASLLPAASTKKSAPDPSGTLSSALSRLSATGGSSPYDNTGNQSFADQAKTKGLGLLNSAFNFINRPSQAILKGIQAQQTGTSIGHALAQGIEGKGDSINLRGALNTDNFQVGKGYINPDAQAAAERQGGRWAGLLDTAGSAVLDPTTYVGAGLVKDVGKVAAKAATEHLVKTGAEDLAAKVADNIGKKAITKVLNPGELGQFRQAIIDSGAHTTSKQTAEDFASSAIKALDQPEGIKFMGQTVLPTAGKIGSALETVGLANKFDDTGNIVRRSAGQVIKDTKAGQAIDDAFNTFARSGRVFGNGIQDSLRDIRTRATVAESAPAVDAARQLDVLAKQAKATTEDLHTIEQASRDNALPALADDLEASGSHDLAKLARAKNEFDTQARQVIGNPQQDAQVASSVAQKDAVAMTKDKAIANTRVSQIRTAIRNTQQEIESYQPRPGFTSGNYGGRLKAAQDSLKGLTKDLRQAERTASSVQKHAITGTEKAAKLGNTAQQLANTVVLTKHGLTQLKDNPGAVGTALGLTAEEVRNIATKGILPQGISPSDFNDAVKLATKTSKDVVESNPLKTTIGLQKQAAQIQAREQTISDLSKLKASDGAPIVSESPLPGYEAVKTANGDVFVPHEIKKDFLAFDRILSDDKTIGNFSKFVDNWNQLWRAYATVPLLGLGFHERNMIGNVFNNFLAGVRNPAVYGQAFKLQRAIQQATRSPEGFDKGLAALSISDADKKLIQQAKESGTIGNFLVQADQELSPVLYESSKFKKAWSSLNPTDRRNALLRSGTAVGQVVEQNARLALFLDQMAKHGDVGAAAQTVRKYLFDYADLTPFEQNVLRKVIPFYTYMRKNTALQLREAVKQPGIAATGAKIQNEATIQAPDTGDKSIPKYALSAGMVPILGGDNPLLAGISTPLHAAAQALQPAADVVGLIGGKSNPLHPEGGVQEAAGSIINMTGGAPAEAAKFLVSEATGKDLFTGAAVKTDAGTTATRLANALAPAFAKEQTLQQGLTGGGDEARAKLVSALTGLSTLNLTDKRSQSEIYRRTAVVQQSINDLKASGTDVPTIDALRKAGIVPKAVSKKPKTVKVKKAKKPAGLKVKKPKIIKPHKAK